MRYAKLNGKLIEAGSSAPDKATCPACGGTVVRRKRKGAGGKATAFYRHAQGAGGGYPNHQSLQG